MKVIFKFLKKLYPNFDPYDFTRSLIDSFVSGIIAYFVAMPDGQGFDEITIHAIATGALYAGIRSAWKYMVLGLRQTVGNKRARDIPSQDENAS